MKSRAFDYGGVGVVGAVGAVFVLFAACDSSMEDTKVTPFVPFEIDAQALAEAAVNFDDGQLVQISAEAITSQHAASQVKVWISKGAEAPYRAIDPAGTTAPAFPEGTIIVKEQRKLDGSIDAFTLMAKGPAGYAPATNDWHWQRVAADGAITHQGQVDFCVDCHTPRAGADWVFGVPTTNQTP